MNTGIKGIQKVVVGENNSAKTMGSGTLDVFATPAMIAFDGRDCLEECRGRIG